MMKPEFDRNDRSEEGNAGKILCRAGADFVGRNSFFPDTAQRGCDLPGLWRCVLECLIHSRHVFPSWLKNFDPSRDSESEKK